MTTTEFSNEFDILLDSYRRIKLFDEKEEVDSIEFNEYEKSVYLTNALEQIVVELYTGRNTKGEAFETTEELRSNLRGLIKTATISKQSLSGSLLSSDSKFYTLPEDCLFITYESLKIEDDNAGCYDGKNIPIVPVTLDEFNRVKDNPFRGANKRRALRLDAGFNTVEIVSLYDGKYLVRYLSRPLPIVLRDFSEVSVQGVNTVTECNLDKIIHKSILERAVLLALLSKNMYLSSDKK